MGGDCRLGTNRRLGRARDGRLKGGEKLRFADETVSILIEMSHDFGGDFRKEVGHPEEFLGTEFAVVIFVEFVEPFATFLFDSLAHGLDGRFAFRFGKFAVTIGVPGKFFLLHSFQGGFAHGFGIGLPFFDGKLAIFIQIVGLEEFRQGAVAERLAVVGSGERGTAQEGGADEQGLGEFHRE